jgi:hypothetical protein
VQISGKRVGYLSCENALLYQPVVRWALGQDHYIAAHAYLTGGWDRGPRDKGTIGVLLHMGTPADLWGPGDVILPPPPPPGTPPMDPIPAS